MGEYDELREDVEAAYVEFTDRYQSDFLIPLSCTRAVRDAFGDAYRRGYSEGVERGYAGYESYKQQRDREYNELAAANVRVGEALLAAHSALEAVAEAVEQYTMRQHTMDEPLRIKISGEEVLFGNDRGPNDQADAWKYKVVGPHSTWSVGYSSYRKAVAAAMLEARG